MMKGIGKTGWIIGLLTVLSVSVSAKVYWGARSGVARSSLVQKVDLAYWSGSCVGYSAAVLADIPFHGRFSFRPEVALVYQGGSFLSDPIDGLYMLRHKIGSYSLTPSFNLAFNIPISDVKMAVYGGPACDFHLWNNTSTKKIGEGPPLPTEKNLKPFDVGINAGISVEYKCVFFSINTLSGTLDRRSDKPENESPVYQNNLTFSLGYFFR
ncbi:MAG: PorT family protein [Tannerellaceae bacterium]|jgi:hypothetical protein|nr:PorT family protein [Tannerellaceae bacterium]